MTVFYAIHESNSSNSLERVELIRGACQQRGITFISICEANADFRKLPKLRRGDILFNVGRGATKLETLLKVQGVKTLRKTNPSFVTNGGDTTIFSAVHDRIGLPGPKTIHHFPDENSLLQKYVEHLGGYPVVLKPENGSLGQGILYCPDQNSLVSMADIIRRGSEKYIIREFVEHSSKTRVVVLGDEVICRLIHPLRPQDFRTSTTEECEIDQSVDEGMDALAIKALSACEYDFGGVDIIKHKSRGPLLIEVNPPCNFAFIARRTGIDVAGAIVDFLVSKSVTPANATSTE